MKQQRQKTGGREMKTWPDSGPPEVSRSERSRYGWSPRERSPRERSPHEKSPTRLAAGLLAVAIAAGCAVGANDAQGASGSTGAGDSKPAAGVNQAGPSDADVRKVMMESFQARSIAKLDRLDQSELQAACSQYATSPMPAELKTKLEKAALDAVRYPTDGRYLGDFRSGEKIAQSGVGMQFSDNEKTVNGGNCYACHQLAKQELAFGNIGPSLYQYGKLRGNSEAILKYTWGRLWNSHSYNACNAMPRYGAAGILSEDQLRDVMALLLDPKSPVNE